MISLFAVIYFAHFIQQTATSPPQTIDWAQLLLTSGVVVAIVGMIGNLVLAQQKRINDEHTVKVNEAIETGKAERVQDINLSETMSQMTQALKASLDLSIRTAQTGEERNKLQARTADQMVLYGEAIEVIGERIKKMTSELSEGRDEIVGKVTQKVTEQHNENALALKAIREDINTLNTQSLADVKSQLTTIMSRLEELQGVLSKTVTSDFLKGEIAELHAELKIVTGNVEMLAGNIEKMMVPKITEVHPPTESSVPVDGGAVS